MSHYDKISRIYTDGACSGNPGNGGWGVVVCYDDGTIEELGGTERETTNNRMEMQAAIAALEFFRTRGQTEPITLLTDSEYLEKGITQWIHGWKKKGWKTASGNPVLNQDLWQQLDALNSVQVKWQHVKAHAGNTYNERCDTIARAFSLGKMPQLQQNSAQLAARAANLVEYSQNSEIMAANSDMDINAHAPGDALDALPRETRVNQLQNLIETLHIADEIATKGYLITSSELADLMDVNASAVTSRGDHWPWRNWIVSRVRREGNQILWQLERVDLINATESEEY
ncbi:MAG TPA: ribonuclease HI [Oscillatoriaceae cyanobacterium M33_DOE_052]|uniref:Ribonuclease H n=1 Tax=Planktothricoides sp. SpSt-374 TaxID=2282167 RepID=A0A7C3VTZ6_9CYAN|nr:ribonuclease HI [Oscillatoriaceae cyanobacterium M33_DOE_052]